MRRAVTWPANIRPLWTVSESFDSDTLQPRLKHLFLDGECLKTGVSETGFETGSDESESQPIPEPDVEQRPISHPEEIALQGAGHVGDGFVRPGEGAPTPALIQTSDCDPREAERRRLPPLGGALVVAPGA